MAIIQGNAKQGSTRGFYPKVINGSLRFNDDDSAYLSWTPASAGNRKTWTWSGWVKRGNLGTAQPIMTQNPSGSNTEYFSFNTSNKIEFLEYDGAFGYLFTTNQLFRDTGAWYHIVVAMDTTQATSTNRFKVYVNGEQITSWQDNDYPALNAEFNFNTADEHRIGSDERNSNYLDSYLANVHFIDGQALTASDFGETKNGVWVAKDYAGTFGTNGFYLTFEDDTQVEAFNTVLYRGNGGTQSITGVGFQPDLVWLKHRTSGTRSHILSDSVRGANSQLFSDQTAAEDTATNNLTSFDSDGFTVGSAARANASSAPFVAWCWKAGDSNVSNTDGTITSTVRANDTYGFSIVSYTGNATNSTVGHGLSSAPDMVIVKNRGTAGTSWRVYHSSLTSASYYLMLDDTTGELSGTYWNNTAPTSSVFSLGTGSDVNQNGVGHIAYCWAEKTGYSKFGSYTGTGSAGNSITGLGFTPAFLLIKRTDSAENWYIHDATRDVSNPRSAIIYANLSNAEFTSGFNNIDFDSNGFTLQTVDGAFNASGGTYIYAAFADTREAAFWLDQSGNDNDWQPVNLDHNDTVADSPTDNFATLNPLNKGSAITLKDGNLSFTQSATWNGVTGTVGVSSGQWYFEYTYGGGTGGVVGVAKPTYNPSTEPGIADTVWRYRADDGTKRNGGASSSAYGATWTTGDVIGVAYDLDAGTLEFYKNGVSQGVAFTNLAGETVVPVAGTYSSSSASYINFGQQPFKYDPPA